MQTEGPTVLGRRGLGEPELHSKLSPCPNNFFRFLSCKLTVHFSSCP